MKLQKMLMLLTAVMVFATSSDQPLRAQTTPPVKVYQDMTQLERNAFITEQSRRIARDMSGREYEFTPAFEADIQQEVNRFARRLGNGGGDRMGKGDARFIFERGQSQAATLIAAFRARNLSPLIGLYIPWIESEYVNIDRPNAMGSIGMFQFLPKTGEHYGLSVQDLLDVGKSADAAARYITDSVDQFKDDPMKEALALLAYNRGGQKTALDLKALITDQNKQCSICVLNANRGKLDATFQDESVYYVPRFFAAAIVGENPQSFGLQMPPLSSAANR